MTLIKCKIEDCLNNNNGVCLSENIEFNNDYQCGNYKSKNDIYSNLEYKNISLDGKLIENIFKGIPTIKPGEIAYVPIAVQNTHTKCQLEIKQISLKSNDKYIAMGIQTNNNVLSRRNNFIRPNNITFCHIYDGEIIIELNNYILFPFEWFAVWIKIDGLNNNMEEEKRLSLYVEGDFLF